MQMGDGPAAHMSMMTPPEVSYPVSTSSMAIKKYRQKNVLGGKMNAEEIRMNKEMLHEIKQFKLQQFGSPSKSPMK